MNVNFTIVGHYDFTATLYDDLNVPWSYNFGWDVKDKEIISDPEVSSPTETTTPTNTPTSEGPPPLNLPGFSFIGVFGSFAVLFLLVSHKRRL